MTCKIPFNGRQSSKYDRPQNTLMALSFMDPKSDWLPLNEKNGQSVAVKRTVLTAQWIVCADTKIKYYVKNKAACTFSFLVFAQLEGARFAKRCGSFEGVVFILNRTSWFPVPVLLPASVGPWRTRWWPAPLEWGETDPAPLPCHCPVSFITGATIPRTRAFAFASPRHTTSHSFQFLRCRTEAETLLSVHGVVCERTRLLPGITDRARRPVREPPFSFHRRGLTSTHHRRACVYVCV